MNTHYTFSTLSEVLLGVRDVTMYLLEGRGNKLRSTVGGLVQIGYVYYRTSLIRTK